MRAASAARSHNRARYYADRARVLRAKLTWQCHRNHQKAGRAQAYGERRRPSFAAALEGSRHRAISAFTDALSPMMKRSRAKSANPALRRAVLRSPWCISGVLAFRGPQKSHAPFSLPPGERPHPHAFSPAIPAAAYLSIPADAKLIKAVMRGIIAAISAEAEESLASVAQ